MGCLTVKASGSVANFISPTVTPIESARVYFSPTQLGEGTPSPDNVREIVGRTGVELYQCGKNLWKYGDLINKQNNQDYDFTYILMPNQEYTFSAIVESTSPYDTCLIRLEGDGLQEKRIQKSTNEKRTFVTFNSGSKNYNRIRLYAFIAYSQDYYATYKDIQLELGSTATQYEPYQGTTIPFSWKRLPDEYQEVEYIESTGTQAILTDIPCQLPLKTDIDVLFTQSNDSYFCGTRYGDVCICSGGNYQNNVQWALGTYKLTNGIALNTRYLLSTFLDNGNQSIAIDGDVVGTYEYTLSESKVTSMNGNLALFAMRINNSQTFGQYAKAKCYGVKISNNNALLGNFIPCYRKSDNEIGMYDTVSQTFYTNQGIGTFTKGNDVFSDEVYGGYVDLVKGEIVETNVYDILDTVNSESLKSQYNTNQTVFFRCNTDYIFAVNNGIVGLYCENLQPSGMNWGGDSQDSYVNTITRRYNSSQAVCIRMYNSVFNINADDTNEVKKQKINTWLAENPIRISYKLATPITYPLPDYLKTQLQTLKNENTFWSDADSVEIDYDLAETFDIQKAKRKIIMNQPHVETLTGDAVSFATDMKAPLKECKVYFEPVQEGSGDPSPENVRNITGWDKVEVKNGDNVYSIDWTNDVGIVYGGYVDLVKGEVVATHHSFTLDGVNYFVSSGGETYTGTDGTLLAAAYDYIGNNSFKDLPMGVINSIPNSISNKYLVTSNNKIIGIQTANAGPPYYRLVVGASELDDISNRTAIINSLKIWLQNNSIQICYKLAEPIHYSLTPQQILSLKGINNFSCGIKNDLSVRYWNHKKSDSNNIAYEAKNLTFNGTNYIDTGVYLFSEKNINRDFEVVIEDLYGSTTTNETIICAKHNGNSTGFLIRLTPSKNIDFNGTIYMNRNNHNYITIKRINGNISISGEIIVNPNLNFTNAVHQHPLVLGCALEDDGTPYRYATGTIGHITVKWL